MSTTNFQDATTCLSPDRITPIRNLEKLQCLLVQSQLFWADAQANRCQPEAIARSEGSACDLIIFPETFTSGFLGDVEADPETMDAIQDSHI